ALQYLGRLLNDLRDHRQALQVLERARGLAPRSAAVLCEIGRAHFCLRDAAGARRFLDAALEINPYYYPGWQYLLRLLALNKSPDGPRLAERAHQLFPSVFQLALAAAPAHPGPEVARWLGRMLNHYAPLSLRKNNLPPRPRSARRFWKPPGRS